MTQALARIGDPIRVNGFDTFRQGWAQVAARPDGSFVVAWESFGLDGDREGIAYRIFDAAGEPLTIELQGNALTANAQRTPDIAVAADGSFTLIWDSFGVDGSQNGIAARRFGADGLPEGTEFVVNTETLSIQFTPVMATLASGAVAAAWAGFNADGDRYGVVTRLVGPAFEGDPDRVANTTTTYNDFEPAIVATSDGGYVVAWEDWRLTSNTSSTPTLRAQRFDESAEPVGGEIEITGPLERNQDEIELAALPGGGFVAVWDSDAIDDPAQPNGITAQIFGSGGAPAGGRFLVNERGTNPSQPDVVTLADGGFAVAWRSGGVFENGVQVAPAGYYFRAFDANGAARGGETLITDDISLGFEAAELTQLASGDLLFAWVDARDADGDQDVQVQRIGVAPVTEGGDADDDLRGGLGADTLTGGLGDDTLDGGAGADRLVGGDGNDLYRFDDRGDRAIEARGGGTDTILATADVTLGGAEIEVVTLQGSAGLRVIGNGFAAAITGNGGANVLAGGGGGDVLTGGGGRDAFAFLTGDAAGAARITDFSEGDQIALDDRFFGLGDGGIDVRLVTAAQVETALRTGTVLYDARTGVLSIDADGRGGPGAPELILEIDGGARLGTDDILLF